MWSPCPVLISIYEFNVLPWLQTIIKRGETIVSEDDGPIIVCTRNDDLQGVLDATPPNRKQGELVLCQMLILLAWGTHNTLALYPQTDHSFTPLNPYYGWVDITYCKMFSLARASTDIIAWSHGTRTFLSPAHRFCDWQLSSLSSLAQREAVLHWNKS